MSDNSNSTGSTGSSTNSWTLLSPEEAAVDNVGPVDDGTESLGDVPSLSEEITGAAGEFKPSHISVETVLSEEGHQVGTQKVCQETSPESGEGPIPSSPSRMSPPLSLPADLPEESQPPVIHDMVTTSPSDYELLGATPFVTNMDLGASLHIPSSEFPPPEPEESSSAPPLLEDPVATEREVDQPGDVDSTPASAAEQSPVVSAEPVVSIPAETLTAADTSAHDDADVGVAAEAAESSKQYKEEPATESLIDDGSIKVKENEEEKEEEKKEAAAEHDHQVEHDDKVIQEEVGEEEEEEEEEEPSGSFDQGYAGGFDDGLRRRNVPSFDAPRPRTSDEEDEEEELEFKLAEKKEEKAWLSVNKCIAGALVLLFLGSLFLSGDIDDAELSDGEQSQDWLNADPQDMKELLDKLTQENQQIAQLEAQLQSQKEQLDLALQAVVSSGDEVGRADLELENAKLRAELSALPDLKTELESLKARVTELSQLTGAAEAETPAATSAPQSEGQSGQSEQKAAGHDRRKDAKEELQRQKILLEESGKRLEGMKEDGGDRKKVRDNLEAIQRKLSEKVDKWGERKWKGDKARGGKRDHWKKEEKKKQQQQRKGEKEWKQGKEGGWREKEEKKEKERKQNSHKEAWRKHQDEWERKKGERRMDREERRKEKPWHSHQDKDSHHHHHNHHHHHQHQHPHQQQRPHINQKDFWRDQEEKLRRGIRPQPGCSSKEGCASKEGLYPVELPEFEELLEGYLSKLEEGAAGEAKDRVRRLTAGFFEGGVFIHDRARFGDFAEDVADILEDMVDVVLGRKGDDSLEEEMEEFEREALWKFSATA